ncbi:(+)-trans-carveol dehydrogenase [Actinocorallia herbida]|uniref:(+)-trans-carveol dehydrogenase n=1 Tax=Actinocorallia herbida TaxID=58109 RepID=A0A3N1CWI2_9ACTN|nr:mycofactocin-coupled SDR family oxidoreductase [Actinocorallia herbida]ROO85662.1 (+)-trans-carveol dehydrogenase [Actinocorallia herbida]
MAGRMEGKVAFITGAARGQGRSHAVRFAEEGADIIAVDLCEDIASVPYPLATEEDLKETVRLVEATGRRIHAVKADVRDIDGLRKALDEGVAALGRLDFVSANAGIVSGFVKADVLEQQTWLDMIDVNLTGVWNTCKIAIPHLKAAGAGSMVLTSSVMGLSVAENTVHYATAKHGVVGLMKALALELAPHRIRVNSVHPTTLASDMTFNQPTYDIFRPDLEQPTKEDFLVAAATLNPMPGDLIEDIDITNALLFLASDEARYITGVALPVDAGNLL